MKKGKPTGSPLLYSPVAFLILSAGGADYGSFYTVRCILLAAMRDRASVNDVAIRTLKVVYPALLDVGCFSHTLDLVRSRLACSATARRVAFSGESRHVNATRQHAGGVGGKLSANYWSSMETWNPS